MLQGLFSFADLPNLGGRMTFTAGIRPAVCTLYSVPQTILDRPVGTLRWHYDGVLREFPGARLLETSLRLPTTRDGQLWSVMIADRRWDWRNRFIDGVYNERTAVGGIQTTGKKNAKELVELCLDALGESGYDTTSVPTDVYPPAVWNRARADLELQWICDLVGMVVVLKADDTVAIEPLNNASGAALPTTNYLVSDLGATGWKSAAIPSTLRVQGNPTEIQSKLTLTAVGIETDGHLEALADLSYKPAGGFGDPMFFADVAQANRNLAFQSVYKYFRPSAGWDGDGITISSFEQLELLERLSETGADADGRERPLDPVITGAFWPGDERQTTTGSDAVYTGGFRVDKERGVIITDHPVVSFSAGAFAEPTLSITIAYRVRESDNSGYSVYTKDLAISKAPNTTGTRVLAHPELTKVKIVDDVYGAGASDNETNLDTEADSYLSQLSATYDFTKSQDAIYGGLRTIDLDGAISQIEWTSTVDQGPTTRIGRFTEFDLKTKHAAQRRALRRLEQMAGRMSV